MVAIGVNWLLLSGAYLALAGGPTPAETAAALLCGGLGTLWIHRLGRGGPHRLRLKPAAFVPFGAALARMPGETLRVGARLLAAIGTGRGGRERTTEHAGSLAARIPLGGDDPASAGRRGLAVLAACLAPGTFVLRTERGGVRVHAFVPPEPGDAG